MVARDRAHVDDEVLRELQAVLGADFRVLVQTFIADSEHRLDAIRASMAAADAVALREAAHSFKGSALNVGAAPLAELCRAIETRAAGGDASADAAALSALEDEARRVIGALAGRL